LVELHPAKRTRASREEVINNLQYLPFIKGYKRSWICDVSLLKNHLLPRFGKCYMDEIARQDIIKMNYDRREAGAAPGTINRLLILTRYIFNLAIRWEVPGLPCTVVQWCHQHPQSHPRTDCEWTLPNPKTPCWMLAVRR